MTPTRRSISKRFPQISKYRKSDLASHLSALKSVSTHTVAEPGVVDCFLDLTKHDCRDAGGRATQEQLPRDVLEESTGMYPRRVSEAVNHPGLGNSVRAHRLEK